ncbi:hypothetical protein D4764_12G0003750 [Takifugu flavidus]|uniref:G-protein coupled receptors family 1 profile domain-containing protein n=1 Tax=Takifugu flavidus TaxID=433684 RepID=A0A5C6PC62_9TELE|nr:hypothetical protein D4764_12G0003750 [Takifugu flavidus]
MTLERYVAICLPLRHSELCSMRRALHCILLVHGVSFLPCAVVLSMLFASASYNFYTQVMKVAKAASGENKKSTWKGLRTVILHAFQLLLSLIQLWSLYTFVTPVTLTVMTLERYVAICLPLRHSELCSMRRALHCILLVHGVSFLPCAVVLSMLFASASYNFYTQVMKVAKAASGENKKSTWKGLRTVILHAFQLLLSLIQLWCPFIESAIFQIDYMLFINVRYFNYVTFILAPRCLSPLIYGLRDEKFFNALKYLALCGLYKKRLDLFDE